MTQAIHDHLLAVAKPISTPLHEAIADVGSLTLTPANDSSLSETLCRSVVGQQLSTKAAATIWGRFLKASEGSELLRFIQTTDLDTLRACGLSRSKCKALLSIAGHFLSGHLSESALEAMAPQQRCNALIAIWGVGHWTADMVNLFYFAEPDVWPEKDLAVVKTLRCLLGEEKSYDLTAIAERFSPYRSYLALSLWRFKDKQPVESLTENGPRGT